LGRYPGQATAWFDTNHSAVSRYLQRGLQKMLVLQPGDRQQQQNYQQQQAEYFMEKSHQCLKTCCCAVCITG